jgi:hypothetical protein
MKAEQAKVDAMLPSTTNTIHCADDCLQAPVALVVTSSDRQPPQYIIYHRASGKLEGLGAEHPDIQSHKWACATSTTTRRAMAAAFPPM